MSDPSRFRISPRPPVAGRPLEVTYIGPATAVTWQVDSGAPNVVKPDKNGKFKIASVPIGKEIVFSDRLGLPGYLYAEIVIPR